MQRAVLGARGRLEEVSFDPVFGGPTPHARVSGLEKRPDSANSLLKYRSRVRWCRGQMSPQAKGSPSQIGEGKATQGSPCPELLFTSPATPAEASPPLVTLSPSPLRWSRG